MPCTVCGGELRRGGSIVCSYKCSGLYQSRKPKEWQQEKSCDVCGVQWIPKSAQAARKNRSCSRACGHLLRVAEQIKTRYDLNVSPQDLLTNRFCTGCTTLVPLEGFYHCASRVKGSGFCKECQKERSLLNHQRKMQTQPEKMKEQFRNGALLRRYGITLQEYNEILESQEGLCAICRRDASRSSHNVLACDHNHKTGKLRGLLCTRCNRVLGAIEEDVNLLRIMIEWIEHHE